MKPLFQHQLYSRVDCPKCNNRFTIMRKNKIFCSAACAKAYSDAANRAECNTPSQVKRLHNERIIDLYLTLSCRCNELKKWESNAALFKYLEETLVLACEDGGLLREMLLNKYIRWMPIKRYMARIVNHNQYDRWLLEPPTKEKLAEKTEALHPNHGIYTLDNDITFYISRRCFKTRGVDLRVLLANPKKIKLTPGYKKGEFENDVNAPKDAMEPTSNTFEVVERYTDDRNQAIGTAVYAA